MSKYKGLFTFDEDNHKYIPIAQADGIIDTMDYEPDSKKFHEAEYKFYNDLCNKVEGGKDASTKEESLGDGPEGTGKRIKES